MKSEIVRQHPNNMLSRYFVKRRLAVKPENKTTVAVTRKMVPGSINRPEMIPAQNARPIRRNGISLCSTVCSYETRLRYEIKVTKVS